MSEESSRLVAALLRPDGSVVVPPRLAGWLVRVAVADLNGMRQSGRGGGLQNDVILLLEALQKATDFAESDDGSPSGTPDERANRLDIEPISWLTVNEVADAYGCTARAVRKQISSGRLIASKAGRDWRISSTDFDSYRFTRGKL
ncbi:helix-turn-helix domain-containing protein [Subtercola lobariae]|uniref:helix-turn-helix domain-containing protein n=1 Tax=Subtercola lobariae TaxID=1588641 RepID=UPI00166CE844|nr:helix-turn-helix domain-containing protein [Subtercola lobariae]